jgi:hypothetical protein
MEIKINIPKNDYVQPTDVREEVVTAICDAFLRGSVFDTGYLGNSETTINVVRAIGERHFFCTSREHPACCTRPAEIKYRIHGVEMQAAFDVLRKAGYYITCCHMTSSITYRCSKKPERDGKYKVYDGNFYHFID